jgi:SAM-dependent methyltransferase
MERRGGDVVAIDEVDTSNCDWPAGSTAEARAAIHARHQGGEAFERLKGILGSRVERLPINVYDLDEEALGGPFDIVYVGSILLHLRDPVRALERVRAVVKPDGRVFIVDAVDFGLTVLFRTRPVAEFDGIGRPWWWKPNLAGLAQLARSAGFAVEGRPRLVFLKPGPGQPAPWPTIGRAMTRSGRDAAILRARGHPHGLLVARRPSGQ